MSKSPTYGVFVCLLMDKDFQYKAYTHNIPTMGYEAFKI